jgi:polysaccharide deacetylase 2 family uncharacterized protein YibQ
MGYRRGSDPSPLRAGLTHAGLSLLAFGGLSALLGTGIHLSGNAADASPSQQIALFDAPAEGAPSLKARLKSETSNPQQMASADLSAFGTQDVTAEEPDLGVDYVEGQTKLVKVAEVTEQGSASDRSQGIRINGKLVRPGQSLSEVSHVAALDPAPIAGLYETLNGKRLPRISQAGLSPADAYARPFANPGNRPVVALVVGGLGINATHTRSAIDELPPEVTLSFAPDARGLQRWIHKARAAGHEVMIEVPMEAYEYGRMKMHPQTLTTTQTSDQNIAKLNQVLSKATGYFGVINYQGAKFSTDLNATKPVLRTLSKRGIAFVQDGSLQSTGFDAAAGATSLRFARAAKQVDAKLTAPDITAQFMELETLAREQGVAMGTGYAYPVTIDVAKAWTADLAQKGIVLAPVSALSSVSPIESEVPASFKTGSAAEDPINKAG